MIKSMTGYGRAQVTAGGKIITVEIHSVNQRYLDTTVKLPRAYNYLEEPIKKRIQKAISRAKIDVFVTVDMNESEDVEVKLNKPVLKAYIDAFKQMETEFEISNDITATKLASLPDVFSIRHINEDEEQVKSEIMPVLEAALVEYDEFRRFEGEKMHDDISERVAEIRKYKNKIEECSPLSVDTYRIKLEERIRDILSQAVIDETRLLTEAAIFADKTSVAEETVRLESHLLQMTDMLASGIPIGRKLDFLVQEMNREVNTIASKVNSIELTAYAVEMKSELEKIREQVQNIE